MIGRAPALQIDQRETASYQKRVNIKINQAFQIYGGSSFLHQIFFDDADPYLGEPFPRWI